VDLDKFILIRDASSGGLSDLILVGIAHIVEVRPQGNPVSEGALLTPGDGRILETATTFDEIVQKLYV
jgi:hypothetical protein